MLLRKRLLVLGQQRPVIKDTFTRADDATTLGSAETGQVWAVNSGTWGISSNKGQLVTGQAARYDFAYINSGKTDFVADLTLSTVEDEEGICVAYVDDTHCMWTAYSGANLWLARKSGGAASGVASAAVTKANGDVLRVIKVGTSIKIYVNGVLKISYTLTEAENIAFGSATKQGIYALNATTGRFDNWLLQGGLP